MAIDAPKPKKRRSEAATSFELLMRESTFLSDSDKTLTGKNRRQQSKSGCSQLTHMPTYVRPEGNDDYQSRIEFEDTKDSIIFRFDPVDLQVETLSLQVDTDTRELTISAKYSNAHLPLAMRKDKVNLQSRDSADAAKQLKLTASVCEYCTYSIELPPNLWQRPSKPIRMEGGWLLIPFDKKLCDPTGIIKLAITTTASPKV